MALKKRFREAAHNKFRFFCFCSVLSGLDDCYYCSNIIVSLLFKLCAKCSLRLQEIAKVRACCSEKDFVCLTEKFTINHQIIFLICIFLKHDPYNFLSSFCSKFIYLCCRSAYKKFFSLCCPIFLSFCPCFPFGSF